MRVDIIISNIFKDLLKIKITLNVIHNHISKYELKIKLSSVSNIIAIPGIENIKLQRSLTKKKSMKFKTRHSVISKK